MRGLGLRQKPVALEKIHLKAFNEKLCDIHKRMIHTKKFWSKNAYL